VLDPAANPHQTLSFALDVADKAIKLLAVLLGGIWTYWNYKKSRTYEQKMELQLTGSLFVRNGIFVEIAATLKNLGGTKQAVQQEGAYCEVTAIFEDLSEKSIRIFRVFSKDEYIEPGESIDDCLLFRLDHDASVVWLRINLLVASTSVEWRQVEWIRVDANPIPSTAAIKEGDSHV